MATWSVPERGGIMGFRGGEETRRQLLEEKRGTREGGKSGFLVLRHPRNPDPKDSFKYIIFHLIYILISQGDVSSFSISRLLSLFFPPVVVLDWPWSLSAVAT